MGSTQEEKNSIAREIQKIKLYDPKDWIYPHISWSFWTQENIKGALVQLELKQDWDKTYSVIFAVLSKLFGSSY